MQEATLDDRYLNWLYGQVGNVKTRIKARTHWCLLKQLHKTIFVAIVSNDDNRIADGQEMRYEFLADNEDVQGDPDWMRAPCSMLELLIILSRQLAFIEDDGIPVWFWHLIEVLELAQFNDRVYDDDAEEVISRTLERVIWRQYSYDGHGGLFPLRHAEYDQRKTELWYQLNAYLLEQF